MKIIKIGAPRVIISNPESKHNYFAWPTVSRLQNGKIAVVASGFRLKHVCPFGKTVIAYSENDGETYTLPAPVMDTVLDDRDGGIVPFGKSNVIVTSFNNAIDFQKDTIDTQKEPEALAEYKRAYLDTVTREDEEKALGATFRFSNDYGVTFGKIFKSPVTSPHGPVELLDGSLLWVGRTFNSKNAQRIGIDCIQAYKINPDGRMEFVGEIENVMIDGVQPLSCEPHAVVLDDGTILVHIRVHNYGASIFTIMQSESKDDGKTWSKPRQILRKSGGAPPHLYKLSSGLLLCTYGYRGEPYATAPFGIKVMFSRDNGNTWDADYTLYETETSVDVGYPSTVELADNTLLTVFYAKPTADGPAVIMQQKWRFENEI